MIKLVVFIVESIQAKVERSMRGQSLVASTVGGDC